VKLHIEVTAEDIETGVREDSTCCCPIALALHRIGVEEVSVGDDTIVVYKNAGRFEAETPPEAALFVERFDGCQQVAPFSFDIELHEDEAYEEPEASP